MVYTNPNGNILKWNIQSEKDIQQNINSAAESAERGKQAEAIVARIAQEQGVKVEGLGSKTASVQGRYCDKVKVVYGPDQLRAFLGGQ